jgi:RNA polymerase sigma-70 factor (ECF subfamily)
VLGTGRARADGPFEAIVEAHHAEMHRYRRRVVSRETEADDLLQETFVRAFRTHRALSADADVRAWLFAIATQLYGTHRRSARRRVIIESASADGLPAEIGRPDSERGLRDARKRLEDVIAGLPVKQRLAVAMRKLHDLDYDTIGTSLACSAETARAHVFRALRRICRGLDAASGGGGTVREDLRALAVSTREPARTTA